MPLDEDVRQILSVMSPPDAPDLAELTVENARLAMGATSALNANPEPVAKVENRTIPGPEAWYWLDRWCSREGVDLSTWDCYS